MKGRSRKEKRKTECVRDTYLGELCSRKLVKFIELVSQGVMHDMVRKCEYPVRVDSNRWSVSTHRGWTSTGGSRSKVRERQGGWTE